jgi:hypothetical protein
MRKVVFILIFMSCTLISFAQIPYSKMMLLSNSELIDKGFKYNEDKNQYALTKTSGGKMALNILFALNGETSDIKPSVNDFTVVIQMGESKVASLLTVFYKDETYHDVLTWFAENNIQPIETNSGGISIDRFDVDSLTIELRRDVVNQSVGRMSSGGRNASLNSYDTSYNVYTYTINTTIAPFSNWLTKQEQKKRAREAKGKKQDINDMF